MVVTGVRSCEREGYFHRPPLSLHLRHNSKNYIFQKDKYLFINNFKVFINTDIYSCLFWNLFRKVWSRATSFWSCTKSLTAKPNGEGSSTTLGPSESLAFLFRIAEPCPVALDGLNGLVCCTLNAGRGSENLKLKPPVGVEKELEVDITWRFMGEEVGGEVDGWFRMRGKLKKVFWLLFSMLFWLLFGLVFRGLGGAGVIGSWFTRLARGVGKLNLVRVVGALVRTSFCDSISLPVPETLFVCGLEPNVSWKSSMIGLSRRELEALGVGGFCPFVIPEIKKKRWTLAYILQF